MVHGALSEVAAFGFDQGVELGEEGDGPHEVAACEGKEEGGSPDAVDEWLAVFLCRNDANNSDYSIAAFRFERRDNVHLGIALGRQKPCTSAHRDDDDEADEDAVPIVFSCQHTSAAGVRSLLGG